LQFSYKQWHNSPISALYIAFQNLTGVAPVVFGRLWYTSWHKLFNIRKAGVMAQYHTATPC